MIKYRIPVSTKFSSIFHWTLPVICSQLLQALNTRRGLRGTLFSATKKLFSAGPKPGVAGKVPANPGYVQISLCSNKKYFYTYNILAYSLNSFNTYKFQHYYIKNNLRKVSDEESC